MRKNSRFFLPVQKAAILGFFVVFLFGGEPFGLKIKEAEATFTGTCDVFAPVVLGTDDAQQSGTTMNLTVASMGADLDATTEWVGMRFQNITIPQGATINSAYLKVVPPGSTADEPSVTIYMEDVDDAATFTTGASNLTNRTRTSSVTWNSADLSATGATYHNSANFTSLAQTVVNRGGWTSGNDMAVLIQGTSSTTRDLSIEAFENSGSNPPILHINYTATGLSTCTTVTALDSGTNDAQQSGTTVSTNGNALGGSMDASNEWIGLQFTPLIPQGQSITSAYVMVVPTATDEDEPLITIYAETSDNAAAFAALASNISNRSRTTGTTWSSTDLAAQGSGYENSADIAAEVQEVVNRAGWSSNNMISILMNSQASEFRDLTIKAAEFVGNNSAYLVITYEEPVLPSVTTNAASSVSNSSITLNGNVTDTGGPTVTERGFIIGNQSDLSDGVYITETGTFSTGSYSTSSAGLTPGTLYYFQAYAENSEGEGYGSILSTTTLAMPPGSPTFSSIGSTTMRINWTASNPAGDSYKLERCTGSGCSDFSQIVSGVTNLYYDDTGRSAGTTYRYRVRATIGGNDGSYSTAAEQNTAPGKPFGLDFFDVESTEIGLSFGGGIGNDGFHQVAECYSGGCRSFINENTGTTTTGLLPNTLYEYAVRSRSGQVFGEWTATTSTSTKPASPGTPSFEDVTVTTLTIDWTAPSGGASTYKIERCDGAACSDWEEIDSGIGALTYADSVLAPETLYRYRIRASNVSGDGPYSSIGEITTEVAPVVVERIIRLLPGLRLKGGTRLR